MMLRLTPHAHNLPQREVSVSHLAEEAFAKDQGDCFGALVQVLFDKGLISLADLKKVVAAYGYEVEPL